MKLPRPLYRVWQFWKTLTEKLSSQAWEEVRLILNPSQLALFKHMTTADQAHGYRVMKAIQTACHVKPELQAMDFPSEDLHVAALLHDVGKSRYPIRIWERPLPVVANCLFPEWMNVSGEDAPHGWRRPLVVARKHPAWGAEMSAQAGASPLTVWLIRHHQTENPPSFDHPNAERILHLLKEMDQQN